MSHMTPHEIIKGLAESDPVYETTVYETNHVIGHPSVPLPSKPKKMFVRKCAICRAISRHNEENVLHEASCPWIPAKELIAMKGIINPRETQP